MVWHVQSFLDRSRMPEFLMTGINSPNPVWDISALVIGSQVLLQEKAAQAMTPSLGFTASDLHPSKITTFRHERQSSKQRDARVDYIKGVAQLWELRKLKGLIEIRFYCRNPTMYIEVGGTLLWIYQGYLPSPSTTPTSSCSSDESV